MDDLITRLRAAIDEDEAWAQAVEGTGEWDVPSTGVIQLGGIPDMDGLALATREATASRPDPDTTKERATSTKEMARSYRLSPAHRV